MSNSRPILSMKSTLLLGLLLCFTSVTIGAQSSEFSYQGRLIDGGVNASGPYDLQFRLFAELSDGSPLGDVVLERRGVLVSDGVFTVYLDFGALFDGSPRWLEISLKPASESNFRVLRPRQPVSSVPYSIKSSTAENVSGVVPIANGGTGSSAKSFVDLSTNQIILGNKTFNQTASFTAANITTLTSNGSATFNGGVAFNNADPVSVSGTLNVGGSVIAEQLSATEANINGALSATSVNSGTVFSVGGTPIIRNTSAHLLIGPNVTAAAGLTNAMAIGHGTQVLQSDSIVIGSTPGFFLPLPNTRVGIGVYTPAAKLDVGGQVLIRSNIGNAISGGGLRGLLNVVQVGSGDSNFYMQGANGGRGINFSTNVLAANQDARLVISHYDGTTYQNRFAISPLGDVGIGTITPAAKLDVEGTVRVGVIGLGGSTGVCFNASLVLSSCSSSGRYKHNVASFTPGLDLIRRLRPVSFKWNSNDSDDMGLVAEEVGKVEPLLVTRNSNGEVEGVKYDRVGIVLVNAVREQQLQIEALQKQVALLKAILCKDRPSAAVCK